MSDQTLSRPVSPHVIVTARPATALDVPLPSRVAAPPRPTPHPRWERPVAVASAVFAAMALAVGVLEARLPLGPGNTRVHHAYPFFAAALGIALLLVGTRTGRRKPDSPWARRTALTGLGYTINAVLIGALSYAVTPHGSPGMVKAAGWLEDWFFLVPDVAFLGLLVGALPTGKLQKPARVIVGLGVLSGLLNAFVPRVLDNSTVMNPLGVSALKPLADPSEALVGILLLAAGAYSLVRSIRVARQSRREHRGYGRQALFAGIVLFATLIVQAACPESNLLAAGVTFLVGGTVAATLASRVVITETARSTSENAS